MRCPAGPCRLTRVNSSHRWPPWARSGASGGWTILARDLLSTLRDREVSEVARTLAIEGELEPRAVKDGDSVRGVYRRSVMLASGRFAMLDDGVGFSLVPWKPMLEQRLGQTVSGIVRGGSVSWDVSRQRGVGV